MKELYNLGGDIFGMFFGALYLCFLLYIAYQYICAFVDDRKINITEKLPKKLAKTLGIYDGVSLILTFLLGIGVLLLCTILWPIALTLIILYGILLILRLMARLKKKVSKISKIAHKHLDKVNVEEFKED